MADNPITVVGHAASTATPDVAAGGVCVSVPGSI
jgi:hypothetical protein